MTMLDRILQLMKENNLNAAQLTRKLGISSSSFTDWKNGKGKPSLDVVVKFSDYFNKSIDWLVRGKEFNATEHKNILDISNSQELKLLEKFRLLPPELQDKLLIYADGMLAALPENSDKSKLSV